MILWRVTLPSGKSIALRTRAMVKMDLDHFFDAMRSVLSGDFGAARHYLFHSAWTPL